MRLINAEKLLAHIKDLPTWWADDGGVYGRSMKYPEGMFDCEDVVGSVENAPTVDAVVVTRCKDCKHSTLPSELTQRYGKPGTLTCHNMHAPSNRRNVGSDDFCSYSYPKEANHA